MQPKYHGRLYHESLHCEFSEHTGRHTHTERKKREKTHWTRKQLLSRWLHNGPSQRLCDQRYTLTQAKMERLVRDGARSETKTRYLLRAENHYKATELQNISTLCKLAKTGR